MNGSKQFARRVVRRRELQELTGLARSTIYDRLNPKSPRFDASFPRPFKLGASASAVGWDAEAVENWISTQMEGRI